MGAHPALLQGSQLGDRHMQFKQICLKVSLKSCEARAWNELHEPLTTGPSKGPNNAHIVTDLAVLNDWRGPLSGSDPFLDQLFLEYIDAANPSCCERGL